MRKGLILLEESFFKKIRRRAADYIKKSKIHNRSLNLSHCVI
jgi:hypothetical protein